MSIGLDAGTMFLVGAKQGKDSIEYITQRNCFLTIPDGDDVEQMLSSSGAKIIKVNNRINILGEDAITFSNLLSSFDTSKAVLKRPMKDGLLNSQEEAEAISILSALIEGVIGKPTNAGEICVFSSPANPINNEKNNIFHMAILKEILKKIGYAPVSLNEGLAVIYAENPKMGEGETAMPMSGIGMSFGAGQVNVCMAIRGYPVIEFSLVGSGDYIDKQVSILSGQPMSVVTKIKETKFSFENVDYNNVVLSGLDIHYTNLLNTVLKKFSEKFSEAGKVYEYPIEIVVSGGTSKPKGFEKKFLELVNSVKLPFTVKNVRMASDLLNSVAKGCLIKAIQEQKKK